MFEYECIVIELPKLKIKKISKFPHPSRETEKGEDDADLEPFKLMLMVIGLMEMKKKI